MCHGAADKNCRPDVSARNARAIPNGLPKRTETHKPQSEMKVGAKPKAQTRDGRWQTIGCSAQRIRDAIPKRESRVIRSAPPTAPSLATLT